MQRILVIGATGDTLDDLNAVLGKDYELVTANGDRHPDLIMIDVTATGSEGLTTCEISKNRPETRDIPVICLTGGSGNDVAGVFAAGSQDCVTRPFQPEELLARVRVHLDLKKAKDNMREYEGKLAEKAFYLREALEQLEAMTRSDLLTNLPNRRFMLERLEDEAARAFRHQRPLTVILAVIDAFDNIQHQFGRDCSDLVLQAVADLMKLNRRREDIVARWGPAEFMLLLPETEYADGGRVAERIRCRLDEARMNCAGQTPKVTATLGVAGLDAELGVAGMIKMFEGKIRHSRPTAKNCVILAQE